jgi:peptide/nickel transport system permease protein
VIRADVVASPVPEASARPGRPGGIRVFARRSPLGAIGAVIMLVVIAAGLAAPLVATYDPTRTDATQTFAPPGARHWLGTDHLGRDIYSRLVYGAQVSLAVGLACALLGGLGGGAVGLISGLAGRRIDAVVQPVLDIMQGFPLLVLALVMTAALGSSVGTVIIAISVPFMPRVARVVRAVALGVRQTTYVEAACAIGAGSLRVALRHVFPNTVAPLVVMTTAQLGSAILVEASLSFLGLGIPEPYPSWGRMLSVSATEFAQRAPWLVIFPGLAISLIVFASNLFGDGLRDYLDPRLRI